MGRKCRHARRRTGPLVLAAVIGCLGASLPVSRCLGDDPKPPQESKAQRAQRFLNSGQEPAEPFVPLVPRTAEDTARLEAIKSYCIGRWLENQYRWSDAIVLYRKALENDPKSIAILRALIDACNAARRPEDALKYMQEAEELAPEDYELLGRLGEALEEQGQIEQAIDRYERAMASPQLRRRSPFAVVLRLKLGAARESLEQYEEASRHYLGVMEALERPEDFGLDDLETPPSFLKNRGDTYERFGKAFRQAKRYDDALRAFRQAQAVSPGAAKYGLEIAQIYIDQEKYEPALENVEKYIQERTPQVSRAYEMLATVLTKLGRTDEILPRVEAAAEKDRFNMGLQYFLGTLYDDAGETDKAKEIYTKVIKNPPDGRVYKSLARIYQKEDRVRDLILLLGDGMESQVPGRMGVFEATEEQARLLANDPDTARKVVTTAREIRQAEPRRLKLGALYFVAKVAQFARQFDDAVEFYQLCLELRPKASSIRRELALTLAFSGRTEEAVKEGEQALENEPDNVDAQFSIGRIYDAAGKYAKAIELYEAVLAKVRDNAELAKDIRYLLSNCWVHLGEMTKAEQLLEDVLAQFPDDATANNDLGYLWADQGKNLDRSLEMIRRAVAKEPDNPSYLDSLGWVLFKLGRAAEARKPLEQAVASDYGGSDATILDHLGDVCHRLKEPDKARELWQKAAKLLDEAKGGRRDDKRLKEISDKLKALDEQKSSRGELKREKSDGR